MTGPMDAHGEAVDPTIIEEMRNVVTLWNMWCHKELHGATDGGIHPPPALYSICETILRGNYPLAYLAALVPEEERSTESEWGQAFADANTHLIVVLDGVFKFAQFCSQNGFLHANLTPCGCSTVRDEELRELLGGDNA